MSDRPERSEAEKQAARAARAARTQATVERRKKMLEMRLAGFTFQAISDELGYAGRNAAQADYARVIDSYTQPAAADLIALDAARLDAMLTGLWPTARRGQLGSVDRVLRIMERRARLLGLDAKATLDLPLGGSGSITIQFATPPPDPDAADEVVDLPPIAAPPE